MARAWEGYKRERSREWQDPTATAAIRRVESKWPRMQYSHVVVHLAGESRRFWGGERWVSSSDTAQRFGSEFSAWDVAECLQDGHVDVELWPE